MYLGKGYMGVLHTILATFSQIWNYIKTMLLKVEGKRQYDPSRQISGLEEKNLLEDPKISAEISR